MKPAIVPRIREMSVSIYTVRIGQFKNTALWVLFRLVVLKWFK